MVLKDCLFCGVQTDSPEYARDPGKGIVMENSMSYAMRDGFPVTPMHTLIIPKRHIRDYFELRNDELLSCSELIHSLKDEMLKLDETITGFNIGINNGESSGQTIFHCHIHLIPRRDGDVPNPRGGVRHIIPGKGNY